MIAPPTPRTTEVAAPTSGAIRRLAALPGDGHRSGNPGAAAHRHFHGRTAGGRAGGDSRCSHRLGPDIALRVAHLEFQSTGIPARNPDPATSILINKEASWCNWCCLIGVAFTSLAGRTWVQLHEISIIGPWSSCGGSDDGSRHRAG